MKPLSLFLLVLFVALPDKNAAAQDLVITNGRILDGTGKVIERGAVVVRNGKIASVRAGTPAAAPGARVIDARGMTVMPGFIDAHRHPVPGRRRRVAGKRRPRRCGSSSRLASRRSSGGDRTR